MPHHTESTTVASNAHHFHAFRTKNASEDGPVSPSCDGSTEELQGALMRKGLFGLARRAQTKTAKLWRTDGTGPHKQSKIVEESPQEMMENSPPFNSSRLGKKERFRLGKTTNRTLEAFQSIGNAVVHPVKSAKSTATRTTASQLSKTERPFLSQNADIELLEAHDNLQRVESLNLSKQQTSGEELQSLINGHRDEICEMEEHRESLRAAWTTIRHVRRVRVVPKQYINFPDNGLFIERGGQEDFVRYNWLKRLGYVTTRVSG